MQVDFGKTSEDYARFRAGFPESLFDRLAGHGVGLAGQQILDLGTGTGTLARGFAVRGSTVTAVDVAAEQLAQARWLDELAGVQVEYHVAPAEETGLPDDNFDVVTAGQCWHWFDRPRAAAEVARLLRPGGTLVIAHYDWLPLAGNVVELTEELILRYNPAWRLGGGTGIYPLWFRDVAEAGFTQIESFTYDEPAIYSHEAWRGRVRASAPIGGSLPPVEVAGFDADLAAALASRFPGEPLAVPHRVFALICRKV
ncbi:MAG: class I SAM-dependent methyltransferase [Anaerolineae bacterium]|nr:class I SAM-dependent methyltransferase [Anaerolineae bacterium]MCO5242263.1 class I SAM-dependent methyltransferase [Anaerolineae bacterium]